MKKLVVIAVLMSTMARGGADSGCTPSDDQARADTDDHCV